MKVGEQNVPPVLAAAVDEDLKLLGSAEEVASYWVPGQKERPDQNVQTLGGKLYVATSKGLSIYRMTAGWNKPQASAGEDGKAWAIEAKMTPWRAVEGVALHTTIEFSDAEGGQVRVSALHIEKPAEDIPSPRMPFAPQWPVRLTHDVQAWDELFEACFERAGGRKATT